MAKKLTKRQIAAIFRITGFLLAAGFLLRIRLGPEDLPEGGFMGRAFCNTMAAIGALIFTIGSVLRFRVLLKEQKALNEAE